MTTTATTVLTRDERRLLARINRWRRSTRRLDPSWWEQSFWPGWYRTFDGLTEVCWAPDRVQIDTLEITWRESRYGPERTAQVPVKSVTEGVDVLCALGLLPAEFSSAYRAGAQGLARQLTGSRCGAGCCRDEPEDGALILRNETQAWVRSDDEAEQATGTWWRLDGTEDGDGPYSWGEVLGLDDPPGDRQPVSWERLWGETDIDRAAGAL